jgi:hypothetical protein
LVSRYLGEVAAAGPLIAKPLTGRARIKHLVSPGRMSRSLKKYRKPSQATAFATAVYDPRIPLTV